MFAAINADDPVGLAIHLRGAIGLIALLRGRVSTPRKSRPSCRDDSRVRPAFRNTPDELPGRGEHILTAWERRRYREDSVLLIRRFLCRRPRSCGLLLSVARLL